VSETEFNSPSEVVSLSATPLTPDYIQFLPTEVPSDGLTVRAWRGAIQPFVDDSVARFVLSEIEAGRQLWISAGSIQGGTPAKPHVLDPLLVNMAVPCQILVCEQIDAMPRIYLLSPRYFEHYGLGVHPHPRGDQLITYKGARIPGLCVFSSAEVIFDTKQNFYTQILDQVTQYVAKHLIWLRTRRLLRIAGNQVTVLYQPLPGEMITENPPLEHIITLPSGRPIKVKDYWIGYWPGEKARATTPLQHVQQIRPNQRCWCGLERDYAQCHRAQEVATLTPKLQKRYQHT
jgi:hypothetical protein